MATIPDIPDWVDEVLQVETTDRVLGGPDGTINVQAKNLADRTAYLKQQVEDAGALAAQADGKADDALAQIAAVEQAAGSAADAAQAASAAQVAAVAAAAQASASQSAAAVDAASAAFHAGAASTAANTAAQADVSAQAAATAAIAASNVATGVRDELLAGRDEAVAAGTAAAAAAGAAASSAGEADAARIEAEAAVVSAEAAQVAAEQARDAAVLAGNCYDTTALGIAATTEGQYFSVPSADAGGLIDYYRHSAGAVAEYQGTYPSKTALDAVLSRIASTTGNTVDITDESGRVALRIHEDGDVQGVAFRTEGARVDTTGVTADRIVTGAVAAEDAAGAAHAVADESGLVGVQVDADGRLMADTALVARQFRGEWDQQAGDFGSEINHILWYGQSWSLGFDSQPAVSTVQRHNTLMFNGGIRQLQSVAENPAALQSFVPAVESNSTGTPEFPTSSLGETGAVAMAHMICDLVERENNIHYSQHGHQLLLSAPGEGSKTLEELADPLQPFLQRLLEQIDRGFAIAQSLGKTYEVTAVCWEQGSGASNGLTYAADLEALRATISAHAQSVTGQSREVKLITWQLMPQNNSQSSQSSATGVYNRFVLSTDTYPHIVCCGPAYQCVMNSSTNVHLRPQSSARIGMAMGLAYKRTIIDGVKYQPLRPVSLRRQGNIALLRLNVDDGHLYRDVETQVAAANDGFGLFDAAGAAISISSVQIISRDTIKITAAATIPAGAKLRYAAAGTDYTEANKWRGNIRDNSHRATGINRWLVAFGIGFDN